MTQATILGVGGSFGSGLASLTVKHKDGTVHTLYADNGPLIRALDSAFGDVITAGHRFDVNAVKGKRIRYEMDDMGLTMAYFVPGWRD